MLTPDSPQEPAPIDLEHFKAVLGRELRAEDAREREVTDCVLPDGLVLEIASDLAYVFVDTERLKVERAINLAVNQVCLKMGIHDEVDILQLRRMVMEQILDATNKVRWSRKVIFQRRIESV